MWMADKDEISYHPERANMTHSEVYRYEVSTRTTVGNSEDVIAYEPRFEHLRHANDVIAGQMATDTYSDWTGSLDYQATAINLPNVTKCFNSKYLHLFQDTADTPKAAGFFSNKIGKSSIIPKKGRI